MAGRARLGVVADGPHRHAPEGVPGARVAHGPGILPHVKRGLDVAVLRVGQGRDEQAAPRRLARVLVREPHGGAAPVHLRDLAGLVLEVVGGAPGRDEGLVAPAERVVAPGDQPVAGSLVAMLLPEQPRRHPVAPRPRARPLPVGLGIRVPRLPLCGEEQAARLAAGHVRHVSPGQASLVGGLPRELGAPLGDVPGRPYLPPGHAPRRQPRDQLGPYPPRRPRHFPSLSEWRVGQAWEAVALASVPGWSHTRDWVVTHLVWAVIYDANNHFCYLIDPRHYSPLYSSFQF